MTLQINPANKTFAFFGHDFGQPATFGGEGFIQWDLTNLGTTHGSFISWDDDLFFSVFTGQPGNFLLGYDTELRTSAANGGTFRITLGISTDQFQQQITGLGNFRSYGGLHETDQAVFESLIGSTFAVTAGSIFHTMDVTVVPEPSSMALFGLALTGLLGTRRRKA